MTAFAPVIETGATFSPCGTYRYTLTRTWDPERGRVAFVGFNPSTADAFEDDPTIRRCIGFARSWGFGSFVMLNLFAYRATDPREIARQVDPVGPRNDGAIRETVATCGRVVAAWGALAEPYRDEARSTLRLLWGAVRTSQVCHLGDLTRTGHPRHPLYLRGDAEVGLYPAGALDP